MQTAIETPVPGEETTMNVTPQLPWSSIPKFTPGTTNVQEYTQKLKFLAAMWPSEYLSQLAPRAALLVEGTAFRKVSHLDPSKLRVNDQTGVALLVNAIGGSWGATELEERYEYFEKALYGTVQRSDETHDSYLSRMEANFIELLSRETKLEEVQAYVLLRQSLLSPDDKKKILLEHSGELKYEPVVKSFRLLGSKFFSELQGGRSTGKTKVYDVNVAELADSECARSSEEMPAERAFVAMMDDQEPELDAEFMEVMLASEDHDALVVNAFEQELEDFLQDVPDMHDAMVSYIEARSKLLEKRRSRGFWPVKFSGKDGRPAFKGKGRGKGKKQRDQLLARIARSTSRICHQKGHWKAECPNREKNTDGSQTASANIAEASHAAAVQEVHSEPESAPSDVADTPSSFPVCFSKFCEDPTCDVADAFVVQALTSESLKTALSQRMKTFLGNKFQPKETNVQHPPRFAMTVKQPCFKWNAKGSELPEPLPEMCHVASTCDKPCHAILDTGASRCVIGEKNWQQLASRLPSDLQNKIRKYPSKVKFRFGNNQTLQSEYQLSSAAVARSSIIQETFLADHRSFARRNTIFVQQTCVQTIGGHSEHHQ